mgnify:CR=1 FL=1
MVWKTNDQEIRIGSRVLCIYSEAGAKGRTGTVRDIWDGDPTICLVKLDPLMSDTWFIPMGNLKCIEEEQK